MSGTLRIEYLDVYYHVLNRGLTGQTVYVLESDFVGALN